MNETVVAMGMGLAVPALLPIMYCVIYAMLRLAGKLCVNRDGWHAGSVVAGKWVLLSPILLFNVFHPLLRMESRLYGRLADRGNEKSGDVVVSDVVVEVVGVV